MIFLYKDESDLKQQVDNYLSDVDDKTFIENKIKQIKKSDDSVDVFLIKQNKELREAKKLNGFIMSNEEKYAEED